MVTSRTVVIAPDSFKGTLGAGDVAEALAAGWATVRPSDDIRRYPQADGGEGTLAALAGSIFGCEMRSAGPVPGPDGRLVEGRWLRMPDGGAVIEMAQMSGLPLMTALDPLGATSRGLGDVIAAALDDGATRLVIGIGGSASTDGGVPVLEALGSRRPPAGGAVVVTDVTAPLLGDTGAAAVFGPQKGADARQIEALERRLEKVARRLGGDPGLPGAGAAGGVGFALAAWGASLVPGSSYIAELTGLADALGRCDVVLTGEGRFDATSEHGKVVGNILERAAGRRCDVGVIAGELQARPRTAWSTSLVELAGSTTSAMTDTRRWLRAAGALAAKALGNSPSGEEPAGTMVSP